MAKLHEKLHTYFRYEHFKEGQEEIITDVLNGKDVLGILPTGSGKSLCFQLPAKLLPGITLVVSPLISLMIDQVRQVKAFYFKDVVAIHSGLSYQRRKEIIEQLHTYKLVYVSPELLQQLHFFNRLKEISVSLFVVDEAHCISQWGYDFRPDYLRLKDNLREIGNPVVMALSGTATPAVQNDIARLLGRPKMSRHIYAMNRKNISLVIRKVTGEAEKKQQLKTLVTTIDQPTLIYFSSRKETERVTAFLQKELGAKRIAYYHGGMSSTDRLKVQQQFMHDQLDIILCTNAFGMGVNKANIRLVIHYHMPTQLEAFIQEIGRAGRDGAESVSVLLHGPDDINLPLYIINNELPTKAELLNAFNRLQECANEGVVLPGKLEAIADMFSLSDVKWRFIAYHLDEAKIINEHKVHYDKQLWDKTLQELGDLSERRTVQKQQKLQEVVQYVQATDCLRTHLYCLFDDVVPVKEQQCCSNCSFTFAAWEPADKTSAVSVPDQINWENRLSTLLLVGEVK